jgi:hypothetical protein
MRLSLILRTASLPFFIFAICGQASVTVVRVPGTSNPYLAGMPDGTWASHGDRAPEQSPVLVLVTLADGAAVSFAASGAVEHGPYSPPAYDPPTGSLITSHLDGAEHGIADITAPFNSLVGVFLDDHRPDRSPAPRRLNLKDAGRDVVSVEPQLKQIFFIGDGKTRKGVRRRFIVPKGATRLFLGTMDGFEWSNNHGAFTVAVAVERPQVTSNIFDVDSHVRFAEWACMPGRPQCTPEEPVIKEVEPGLYYVVLPAQLQWGASVPTPAGATVTFRGAAGTVCLDAASQAAGKCNGPLGNGETAGAGFVVPGGAGGALVRKTVDGRTYFSVNGRDGDWFQKHQGYFEFNVVVK